MPTLKEVADSLDLSYQQAFRRFEKVRELLADHVRRADNNELILDDAAYGAIRSIEQFVKGGWTLSEAAAKLAGSLKGESDKARETSDENGAVAVLEERVQALTRENGILRESLRDKEQERDWLRGLVDELRDQLALAAPRELSSAEESMKPQRRRFRIFPRWRRS